MFALVLYKTLVLPTWIFFWGGVLIFGLGGGCFLLGGSSANHPVQTLVAWFYMIFMIQKHCKTGAPIW